MNMDPSDRPQRQTQARTITLKLPDNQRLINLAVGALIAIGLVLTIAMGTAGWFAWQNHQYETRLVKARAVHEQEFDVIAAALEQLITNAEERWTLLEQDLTAARNATKADAIVPAKFEADAELLRRDTDMFPQQLAALNTLEDALREEHRIRPDDALRGADDRQRQTEMQARVTRLSVRMERVPEWITTANAHRDALLRRAAEQRRVAAAATARPAAPRTTAARPSAVRPATTQTQWVRPMVVNPAPVFVPSFHFSSGYHRPYYGHPGYYRHHPAYYHHRRARPHTGIGFSFVIR